LQRTQFFLSEGQRLAHMGSWAFSATGFDYWSYELCHIHGVDPTDMPRTPVFFGMIGNAFLGLVFTPVLYVTITAISERIGKPKKEASIAAPPLPLKPPRNGVLITLIIAISVTGSELRKSGLTGTSST